MERRIFTSKGNENERENYSKVVLQKQMLLTKPTKASAAKKSEKEIEIKAVEPKASSAGNQTLNTRYLPTFTPLFTLIIANDLTQIPSNHVSFNYRQSS